MSPPNMIHISSTFPSQSAPEPNITFAPVLNEDSDSGSNTDTSYLQPSLKSKYTTDTESSYAIATTSAPKIQTSSSSTSTYMPSKPVRAFFLAGTSEDGTPLYPLRTLDPSSYPPSNANSGTSTLLSDNILYQIRPGTQPRFSYRTES